jgi:hypothetical protein
MFGLLVIIIAFAYFLFSIYLIAKFKRHLGFIWASGVGLFMYLIVFWDQIPTLILHKHYCETEAGFWVYKTPEQWAKENPGVLESLRPWPAAKIYGKDKVEYELNGGAVKQYNDRFGYWSKSHANLHGLLLDKHESGIVDTKTFEFIVRYINFRSGPRGAGVIWKSWLNNTCDTARNVVPVRQIAKQLNMGDL